MRAENRRGRSQLVEEGAGQGGRAADSCDVSGDAKDQKARH